MLATASSRPASAGPAKKPTLSIVDEATFAAASSAGPSESSGRSEACADDDEDRLRDVRTDHDEPAGIPVAEHRGERRDERPQDVARDADQPDRRRAALLVCVDRERGRIGPVADDRPRPGKLYAPQPGVAEDRPQRVG